LYAKAAQTVCDMFRDDNILFVDTRDSDDKIEFVRSAKQELVQHNTDFKDIFYKKESFSGDVEQLLRKDKRNVIIPVSGSVEALNKIRPTLRSLAERMPEVPVTLFGYPEWQIYARESLEDFFMLNTYIYTNFYTDNMSAEVDKFNTKYKMWYSKTPSNTYPKYGMLGFDTGMFFIEAIARYGTNFEGYLDKMRYKSLQTGFNFQRVNNWGGFINTNLFIVHYNKGSYKVTRQELKQ
jgi:hypothetical protein